MIKKFLKRKILSNILILIYTTYYAFIFKPLIIRKNTTDIDVFYQIFIRKEYDIPLEINPLLIIDAGANVGYASLFFAHKYPNAEIIAVEPEESNFKILEQNTQRYKNIKRIKAGIWHKNAYLKIIDNKCGEWGFMTKEVKPSENYDIKSITVDDILKKFNHERVDILKIDIEGAEKELFSKDYEPWLDKVKVIFIELHEEMKEGCNKAFWSAIKKYNFKKMKKGENIIIIKN